MCYDSIIDWYNLVSYTVTSYDVLIVLYALLSICAETIIIVCH